LADFADSLDSAVDLTVPGGSSGALARAPSCVSHPESDSVSFSDRGLEVKHSLYMPSTIAFKVALGRITSSAITGSGT
jgi:hypothetical protein